MKQLTFLAIAAFACTLAHAAESTPKQKAQQTRMAQCQKEATASGKKGQERSDMLRGCLAAGKKSGKEAKPA